MIKLKIITRAHFPSRPPFFHSPSETDLFKFLKAKKGGLMGNDIKWNFTKVRGKKRKKEIFNQSRPLSRSLTPVFLLLPQFLVDRNGNVVGRYPSTTAPEAIEADIKKYI